MRSREEIIELFNKVELLQVRLEMLHERLEYVQDPKAPRIHAAINSMQSIMAALYWALTTDEEYDANHDPGRLSMKDFLAKTEQVLATWYPS